MTARIFSVVLAVSLVLGEGRATPSPLNSVEEPIKQVHMESLYQVPEEKWTAITSQKPPSTSGHEEITVINRVDSPPLSDSPSLEVVEEDALSSSHMSVEDTANTENISEGSFVHPTNLPSGSEATANPQEAAGQGAGLARVLQDLGMTDENSTVLDMLGPDFNGDLNRMTFNDIMAALDEAKKMEAWDEEKEAWGNAKDEWLEETGDGYGWRVHTYPSEDKYLEKWENWVETSVEKAQQEEEEFELWNYHQHFVLTLFTCLLIVAALAVVTHQCYIERKLKRRASLEMQASALPVKEPLMPPMFVIVPQQLTGKQHLY